MNISLAWILDPSTNKPSVSLTNLVISIAFLLTMSVLQALGKVQEVGSAMEYFGISSALYFSRRVNFSKGTVDVGDNSQNGNP